MSLEENKEVIRRSVSEFWNTGDVDALDRIYGKEYMGHDPDGFFAGTREQFRQTAQAIFAGFSDMEVIIDDLIAEGDKVVKKWTSRSVHTGEFMGIPPTGKAMEITGTTVYRIAGGKIVECWSNADRMGMLQQLGVIPPMG